MGGHRVREFMIKTGGFPIQITLKSVLKNSGIAFGILGIATAFCFLVQTDLRIGHARPAVVRFGGAVCVPLYGWLC